MFDQSLPFAMVQKRRNKFRTAETYQQELIYKFHCYNRRCGIKYIVSIKQYKDEFLTLDYYPKINLTPKKHSLDNIQDLRYRMLTKQNSFGSIGATILDIMIDVEQMTSIKNWGFLAANLPDESSNENNKRYQVYKEVLSRTFYRRYAVFGNKENSAIFVIDKRREQEKQRIIEEYEQIFSETN